MPHIPPEVADLTEFLCSVYLDETVSEMIDMAEKIKYQNTQAFQNFNGEIENIQMKITKSVNLSADVVKTANTPNCLYEAMVPHLRDLHTFKTAKPWEELRILVGKYINQRITTMDEKNSLFILSLTDSIVAYYKETTKTTYDQTLYYKADTNEERVSFIEKLSNGTVYGRNLPLKAIADKFNIRILVINEEEKYPKGISNILPVSNEYPKYSRIVCLIHRMPRINDKVTHHFQSLFNITPQQQKLIPKTPKI